jgi:hypothetical protein
LPGKQKVNSQANWTHLVFEFRSVAISDTLAADQTLVDTLAKSVLWPETVVVVKTALAIE